MSRRLLTALLLVALSTAMATACRTAPSPQPQEEEQQDEAAVDEAPAVQEGGPARYADPQGRFTAPLPPNWSVTEHDGYVTLSDPQGHTRVHLSVQSTDDPEGAIDAAWGLLEEAPELPLQQAIRPPAPEQLDALLLHQYEVVDGYFGQALAQQIGDEVYVALIEGPVAEIQRRNAQLQTIVTGFRPAAVDQVDLSQLEARDLGAAELEELSAFIVQTMEAMTIPGVSIGIVQNGEVVYQEAFGVRQLGSDQPMTPETLLMVGSTTKTMTTLLLAQLVDEGLLDWDTPVQDVLPQFAVQDEELSRTITIENLVCACTGVPRKDFEIIFNASNLTAEAVVESLAEFEFYTEIGETFQYSNQMVAAAGYVAAAALSSEYGALYAGYTQAMAERIFSPLGMTATTAVFDEALQSDNHAFPHNIGLAGAYEAFDIEPERFVDPLAPAGSVWSNTADMTRYIITMLSGGLSPEGTRQVSQENLHRLWQPQVEISARDNYGLGWIVSSHQGLDVLSHGGNTLGFTSELVLLPQADTGITILVNGGGANAFTAALRTRLVELLYDRPTRAQEEVDFARELVAQQRTEFNERLTREVDPARVEPFTGRYRNADLGEVTLNWQESRLVFDAGEFAVEVGLLRPRSGNADESQQLTFVVVEPPFVGMELKGELSDQGRPLLRFGEGLVAYEFEKVE